MSAYIYIGRRENICFLSGLCLVENVCLNWPVVFFSFANAVSNSTSFTNNLTSQYKELCTCMYELTHWPPRIIKFLHIYAAEKTYMISRRLIICVKVAVVVALLCSFPSRILNSNTKSFTNNLTSKSIRLKKISLQCEKQLVSQA